MEIDLELPSGEQERFDAHPNTSNYVMDGADRDNVEEDAPIRKNKVTEDPQQIAEKTVSSGSDVRASNALACFSHRFNHTRGVCEPKNGLEFETKEAAYSFYREYAWSIGFGITIKASRRSKKSGNFIDVKIMCSRFGSKHRCDEVVNPRSCMKTDCKAGMHVKRKDDGRWVIHNFVKEHNHEICSDDLHYSIKGKNKQSTVVSCQNKGLQLVLDYDDVQVMLEQFLIMQSENPNFFYAIDLDSEKCLRSVFWIDDKGKHDYEKFSDVIFFDTFYIKEKYNLPLVPVVGVNHHLQYTLLGCALIGDDSASSYIWLMRTWLKAIGGHSPGVIITDLDKPMEEAVTCVFPDIRHVVGFWHVLEFIHDYMRDEPDKYEDFVMKLNKCIYQSWDSEQFEQGWWKLVQSFDLEGNDWVHSLYDNRKKWVPTYFDNAMLAGMSPSGRSKSLTAFFDKYTLRETTIEEFMQQYKMHIQERYEMEMEADAEVRQKPPTLKSVSPFEKQMSRIYTHALFKLFQDEVLGVASCNLHKASESGELAIFQVEDFGEGQYFFATLNERKMNINCSCRSFECRGYLCRHAILVLQNSGISSIPSQYILKRWTINVKIMQTVGEKSLGFPHRLQRFNDLCKLAIKLGQEGSLTQEAYHTAFQAIDQVLRQCVEVNNSAINSPDPNPMATHCFGTRQEYQGNSLAKAYTKKKRHKKRKML